VDGLFEIVQYSESKIPFRFDAFQVFEVILFFLGVYVKVDGVHDVPCEFFLFVFLKNDHKLSLKIIESLVFFPVDELLPFHR
jgi:hypothetical protein